MKPTLIIQEAKEIKSFIEKNRTLPNYCTINGKGINIYRTAYLLGKLLSNCAQTDIEAKNIQKYNNRVKSNINEKVFLNDYMDMNNNFVKYCESNGRVPAYITTQKSRTQVSFELFFYCLSKIIVFYANNKALPKYCIFNSADIKETQSSNSKGSYTMTPALTTPETGLGQDYPWDCSCASLQQCLYHLNRVIIPESTLISVMGVTTAGVGHQGFATGIAWFNNKYGTNYKIRWVNFSDLGKTINERFLALGKLLSQEDTAVLTHIGYGNSGYSPITKNTKIFGHYECIYNINTSTRTVYALNSLGTKKNANAYNGYIQTRTFETQASFFANTPGGQPSVCIITKK